SALSLSGFVLLLGEDPGSVSVLLGLGNRTLTLLAIWATAILGLLWIKKDRRLEEEQARLQAVIDTSADAVVTIDEGGGIQSFRRCSGHYRWRRDHPTRQPCWRTALRLSGKRGDRPERQHADALAPSGGS